VPTKLAQAQQPDCDGRQALSEHALDETREHKRKRGKRQQKRGNRHGQNVPARLVVGNAATAQRAFARCEAIGIMF